MLEIKNIEVAYGKNKILKGVHLSLSEGKIHGILGVNGAGKTTLFNTIYGFKKSSSGSILYQSQPLKNHDIGFLETSCYFYPLMTGAEYLELLSKGNDNFSIKKWNKLFELPLNEYVENYSTGMKKKLAFIGVVAMNRPILILDEPFNGVDIESNEKILQLLLRLQSTGKIIIIASHIIESLTRICDDISLLENGIIKTTFQKSDFHILEKELKDKVKTKIDDLLF
ncbi:MAG TPA: ABC transporter ATP-binding protein [Phaeodactylibacter sp.]|nr:ABC transporter ATP-binding protein [Phaeodactylibacter sp.]